jgi:hypothetical protein
VEVDVNIGEAFLAVVRLRAEADIRKRRVICSTTESAMLGSSTRRSLLLLGKGSASPSIRLDPSRIRG